MSTIQTLSRGQRIKSSDIGLTVGKFSATLSINHRNLAADSVCFGIDGAHKLSDQRCMTSFNQPETLCGVVRLVEASRYEFRLGLLPQNADALTLPLAFDDVTSHHYDHL